MVYSPSGSRYVSMEYRRCGNSGLRLPALSLGLWHNFGFVNDFDNSRAIQHLTTALPILTLPTIMGHRPVLLKRFLERSYRQT
jgi:hypothetical protein